MRKMPVIRRGIRCVFPEEVRELAFLQEPIVWTLKLRRGSSIQRATAGLVLGLFGILCTMLAIHLTAESHIPAVGTVLPMLGVCITMWYWGQATYYLIHAANQQRFAEDDFALDDGGGQPVPSPLRCVQCRAELDPAYRYCPQCGTKI